MNSHRPSRIAVPSLGSLALLAALATLAGYAAPIAGASTAPASPTVTATKPKPTVSGFTATLGKVTGTTVRPLVVTASVAHAKTCTVVVTSSKTAVEPKPVACTTSLKLDTALPLDKQPTPVEYSVALTVAGPGGSTSPAPITVTLHDVMPVLTSLNGVAGTTTATGTPLTITVTAKRATSCHLSAKPTVSGLPTSHACSKAFQVELPSNTTTMAVSYRFRATAINRFGSSKALTWSYDVPGTVPAPTVTTFTATAASPSASGENVDLEASVVHASSCTFSASGPSGITIAGLPDTVACSAGTASDDPVALPANTTSSAEDYTFSLAVTGPSGQVTADPQTVAVPAAPQGPTISGFTASYQGTNASTYPAEDKVNFVATSVGDATSCSISLDPPVAGYPRNGYCAATESVALTSLVPPNLSSSAASYVATLSATDSSGTSTATTTVTLPPQHVGVGWTAAGEADPAHGLVTNVSCASSTFCAEVDQEGALTTWNGGVWGKPYVAPQRASDGGLGQSISCLSSSFCLNIAQDGSLLVYDGRSWQDSPSNLPAYGSGSTSCATPTSCAVVVAGNVWFGSSTDSTWVEQTSLGAAGDWDSVSCPTASFCAAVGSGYEATWDGTGWTVTIPTNEGPQEVSCASASECLAPEGYDYVTWNGTAWATTAPSGSAYFSYASCAPGGTVCMVPQDGIGSGVLEWNGSDFQDVGLPTDSLAATSGVGLPACATDSFCMFINQAGVDWTWDGGFSQPDYFLPIAGGQYDQLSCLSASWCMAVSTGQWEGASYPSADTYVLWDGTSWSKFALIPDAISMPMALSCTEQSVSGGQQPECMMVDDGGNAFLFDGTSWSGPTVVENGALERVSCVNGGPWCVAIDHTGQAFTFDGTSWSGPVSVDPNGLGFLSCSSPQACVGTDESGSFALWNGTTWTAPAPMDPSGFVPAYVSCSSANSCVAWNGATGIETFDGTSWSSGPTAPTYVQSLTCGPSGACLAFGGDNLLYVFADGAWSAGEQTPLTSMEEIGWQLSCTADSWCMVIGDDPGTTSIAGYLGIVDDPAASDAVASAASPATSGPRALAARSAWRRRGLA